MPTQFTTYAAAVRSEDGPPTSNGICFYDEKGLGVRDPVGPILRTPIESQLSRVDRRLTEVLQDYGPCTFYIGSTSTIRIGGHHLAQQAKSVADIEKLKFNTRTSARGHKKQEHHPAGIYNRWTDRKAKNYTVLVVLAIFSDGDGSAEDFANTGTRTWSGVETPLPHGLNSVFVELSLISKYRKNPPDCCACANETTTAGGEHKEGTNFYSVVYVALKPRTPPSQNEFRSYQEVVVRKSMKGICFFKDTCLSESPIRAETFENQLAVIDGLLNTVLEEFAGHGRFKFTIGSTSVDRTSAADVTEIEYLKMSRTNLYNRWMNGETSDGYKALGYHGFVILAIFSDANSGTISMNGQTIALPHGLNATMHELNLISLTRNVRNATYQSVAAGGEHKLPQFSVVYVALKAENPEDELLIPVGDLDLSGETPNKDDEKPEEGGEDEGENEDGEKDEDGDA